MRQNAARIPRFRVGLEWKVLFEAFGLGDDNGFDRHIAVA